MLLSQDELNVTMIRWGVEHKVLKECTKELEQSTEQFRSFCDSATKERDYERHLHDAQHRQFKEDLERAFADSARALSAHQMEVQELTDDLKRVTEQRRMLEQESLLMTAAQENVAKASDAHQVATDEEAINRSTAANVNSAKLDAGAHTRMESASEPFVPVSKQSIVQASHLSVIGGALPKVQISRRRSSGSASASRRTLLDETTVDQNIAPQPQELHPTTTETMDVTMNDKSIGRARKDVAASGELDDTAKGPEPKRKRPSGVGSRRRLSGGKVQREAELNTGAALDIFSF